MTDPSDGEPVLIDVPSVEREKLATFAQIDHPIWTKNKAKLIERYLYYFIWVTRHGTYIDGFAGPQRINEPSMWAARLVLANRPAWLRHFHLFEINQRKIGMLRSLRERELAESTEKRSIDVHPGDFNETVGPFLRDNPIKPNEATFCLLDQRTFECDWATVTTLATHKSQGLKIELFYFLANSWLHRAAGGMTRNKADRMEKWYGNDGWKQFLKERSFDRAARFTARFREELGYRYVFQFPIFGNENGRRTMYWMIHASDHPAASKLMYRAYNCALNVKEDDRQMDLISREAEALGG